MIDWGLIKNVAFVIADILLIVYVVRRVRRGGR